MKYIKLLIVFILFISIPKNCLASTNTLTRTREKPLVPDRVIVDENNIDEILLTPAVSSNEKIYDFAELYTEEEEKKLYQKAINYTNNSSIDLVIVTTKDLRGFNLEKYTYNFYDYNLFNREGIIFVIYVNGNKNEIYMGNIGSSSSVVFDVYTDKRINQTLEYIYSDIKQGNYYSATDNYIKTVEGFYNLNKNENYLINKEGKIVKSIPWFELIIFASAITIIVTILFSYKLRINKLPIVYSLDDNINEATMMVKFTKDELIETTTDKK